MNSCQLTGAPCATCTGGVCASTGARWADTQPPAASEPAGLTPFGSILSQASVDWVKMAENAGAFRDSDGNWRCDRKTIEKFAKCLIEDLQKLGIATINATANVMRLAEKKAVRSRYEIEANLAQQQAASPTQKPDTAPPVAGEVEPPWEIIHQLERVAGCCEQGVSEPQDAEWMRKAAAVLRATPAEAPAITVQAEPAPEFYCNKCGYFGPTQYPHKKANHDSQCNYMASPMAHPKPAAQSESELEDPCERPPLGWRCTRANGHEGPCAAVETPEDIAFVEAGMRRLRDGGFFEDKPAAQEAATQLPAPEASKGGALTVIGWVKGYEFSTVKREGWRAAYVVEEGAAAPPVVGASSSESVPVKEISDEQIEKHLRIILGNAEPKFPEGVPNYWLTPDDIRALFWALAATQAPPADQQHGTAVSVISDLIDALRKKYGHPFLVGNDPTMQYDLSSHPLIRAAILALRATPPKEAP